MKTRRHEHEIELNDPPQHVFELLHTPSAIRGWWGASRAIVMPKPGGMWCAAWGEDEDHPDYITTAVMTVFQPPQDGSKASGEGRIRFEHYSYHARTGALPFEADFVTEFTVRPKADGGSVLKVVQDGFPADSSADDFYAACAKGWHDTFESIQRFLGKQT